MTVWSMAVEIARFPLEGRGGALTPKEATLIR